MIESILRWNANWMEFDRSKIRRYVFREEKKKKRQGCLISLLLYALES